MNIENFIDGFASSFAGQGIMMIGLFLPIISPIIVVLVFRTLLLTSDSRLRALVFTLCYGIAVYLSFQISWNVPFEHISLSPNGVAKKLMVFSVGFSFAVFLRLMRLVLNGRLDLNSVPSRQVHKARQTAHQVPTDQIRSQFAEPPLDTSPLVLQRSPTGPLTIPISLVTVPQDPNYAPLPEYDETAYEPDFGLLLPVTEYEILPEFAEANFGPELMSAPVHEPAYQLTPAPIPDRTPKKPSGRRAAPLPEGTTWY